MAGGDRARKRDAGAAVDQARPGPGLVVRILRRGGFRGVRPRRPSRPARACRRVRPRSRAGRRAPRRGAGGARLRIGARRRRHGRTRWAARAPSARRVVPGGARRADAGSTHTSTWLLAAWAHYRDRRDWEAAFDSSSGTACGITSSRCSATRSTSSSKPDVSPRSRRGARSRASPASKPPCLRSPAPRSHSAAGASPKPRPTPWRRPKGRTSHSAPSQLRAEPRTSTRARRRRSTSTSEPRPLLQTERGPARGRLGTARHASSILESPEATRTLEHLSATVIRSDPNEVVRCAGGRLAYQLKLGTLDLAEADRAHELLERRARSAQFERRFNASMAPR